MIGTQRSQGFTLIELLVVMVVVGLLVALATVSLGGNSLRRDMDNEVEELYLLMEAASEQAVLNNTELGLVIDEETYRFLTYEDKTGDWKPQQERIFRQREIPEWLTVTKRIESDAPRLASNEDKISPDVVFFSSGEATPFELEFVLASSPSTSDEYLHTISSDGVAPLAWNYPGKQEQDDL